MDQQVLRVYKLDSPVNLVYGGQFPLDQFPTELLASGCIIPRTKEEGYALAAWLLVKGIDLPVEFVDGDRTPIHIEEKDYVFLTWKPAAKPEIWFDSYRFEGYYLRCRPPLQNTSNSPTSL